MKGMEKSYFWGMNLDGDHKEKKWEGTTTESTEDGTITTHSLCVRQVVLGPDAKEDELNVIELECLGYEDKKQRIPVCVMKKGGTFVTSVEIVLEDCVGTFHLVRGSGPVHLSGTHQTETTILSEDVDDSMGDEEEDGEEEDDVEDVPIKEKLEELKENIPEDENSESETETEEDFDAEAKIILEVNESEDEIVIKTPFNAIKKIIKSKASTLESKEDKVIKKRKLEIDPFAQTPKIKTPKFKLANSNTPKVSKEKRLKTPKKLIKKLVKTTEKTPVLSNERYMFRERKAAPLRLKTPKNKRNHKNS